MSEISDKKIKYLTKLFERVLALEWGSTAGRVNALGIIVSAAIALLLGLSGFGDWILELARIIKGTEQSAQTGNPEYLIPSNIAAPLIILIGTFVCMHIVSSIERR